MRRDSLGTVWGQSLVHIYPTFGARVEALVLARSMMKGRLVDSVELLLMRWKQKLTVPWLFFYAYGIRSTPFAAKPSNFSTVLSYFFIWLSNSTKPRIFRVYMAKPFMVGFAAEKKEGFAILWFGILPYSWGKTHYFRSLLTLICRNQRQTPQY